jgi:hypothetical protein
MQKKLLLVVGSAVIVVASFTLALSIIDSGFATTIAELVRVIDP